MHVAYFYSIWELDSSRSPSTSIKWILILFFTKECKSIGFEMTCEAEYTSYSKISMICSVRLPCPMWPILHQWDPISHAIEQLNAITVILLTSLTSSVTPLLETLSTLNPSHTVWGQTDPQAVLIPNRSNFARHISEVTETHSSSFWADFFLSNVLLIQNVVHVRHLTVYTTFCQHQQRFWFMPCHRNWFVLHLTL